MFDVLHHLERPRMFFQEAEPALDLVMIEPALLSGSGAPMSGLTVTTPTIWQQSGVVAVQFRCAPPC